MWLFTFHDPAQEYLYKKNCVFACFLQVKRGKLPHDHSIGLQWVFFIGLLIEKHINILFCGFVFNLSSCSIWNKVSNSSMCVPITALISDVVWIIGFSYHWLPIDQCLSWMSIRLANERLNRYHRPTLFVGGQVRGPINSGRNGPSLSWYLVTPFLKEACNELPTKMVLCYHNDYWYLECNFLTLSSFTVINVCLCCSCHWEWINVNVWSQSRK